MDMIIPAGPEELTPDFLTHLVAELRPGVSVQDVQIKDVKSYGDADTSTSVSTSRRVALEIRYGEGAPNSLPTHVLAKMSLPDNVTWVSELYALFENEVQFYSKLRPELTIEAPQTLGGRFDPESKRYILLLEDLTPRSPHHNTMMDDSSVTLVEKLLDTLARIHAAYWETPRFTTDMAWVKNHVEGPLEDMLNGVLCGNIVQEVAREKFKQEFVGQMGASLDEMQRGVEALKRHQAKLPQTFLHGDAHIGNTYILPDGTPGLLDWQVNARGFVIHDVGYMIQTALSIEDRRKHERELLAGYRECLLSHGVKNPPDMETLWLEYRRSMHYGIYTGWLGCPRENYGLDMTVIAFLRTIAAYQDHGTRQLIADLL